MSDNPIHALRAILTNKRLFDNRVEIHPITIKRYCILDYIDSILLRGFENNLDFRNVVETLYVMTRSNEQLEEINIDDITETLSKPALKWFKKNRKIVKNLEAFMTELVEQMKNIAYVAPDLIDEGKAAKTSNGWISQLIYFATSQLHISITDTICNIPMVQILLMMRQKIYNENDGQSMTLEDKEVIDKL